MENNHSKKEMSINELAEIMQAGFKDVDRKFEGLAKTMQDSFERSDKRMDEKIEELARMTQSGILESEERLVSKLSDSIDEMKAELNKRVEKVDFNTLKYRVEKLEEKLA